MSSVTDIKPWFREDLQRVLASVYFARTMQGGSTPSVPVGHLPQMGERNFGERERRVEFAAALASVALAVGVDPLSFLAPEDVQALKGKV